MTTNIELNDLQEKRKQHEEQQAPNEHLDPGQVSNDAHDGSVAAWAWASATLLALISMILLVFPRFLLFFSTSDENSETALTPLERFLCVQFSFFLFSTSIALVLYIPSEEPFETRRRRDSLGHPLLGPLTGASLLSSFVSYNTKSVSSLSFVVFILTGFIGIWGTWVIMFDGTSRISKKTGADKHTSAFLFHNKHAASVQKREWRKTQREKDS